MYRADLAAFHAAHATRLAQEAATTLVDELAEAQLHHGMVADVGCGDGTLSALLIDAGYEAMAIDPSPACLELVDVRAPAAQRVLATAARMRLPTGLVAIACVGEVLSYDLRIDLDEVLESFNASLRRGGVLVLDLPGPGRHVDGPVVEEHEDAVLVVRAREDGFRLQREITLFSERGDGAYRRSDEIHELRLYEPGDVRAALARAGFVAIRQLARYGAHGPMFGDGWSAFLAERP